MASGWQKDFNKSLDNYISRRREESYKPSGPVNLFALTNKNRITPGKGKEGFEYRAPKPDKAVELEEQELIESEVVVGKRGFFARVQEFIFGEPAPVEKDAKDMLGKKSYYGPGSRSVSSAEFERQSSQSKRVTASYVGPIPSQSARQAMPYSPSSEQEIKYLIKIIEILIHKLSPDKRRDFMRSREYSIFEKLNEKY